MTHAGTWRSRADLLGSVGRLVVALLVAALAVTSGHVHSHEHPPVDVESVVAAHGHDDGSPAAAEAHVEVRPAGGHADADHVEVATRTSAASPDAPSQRPSTTPPSRVAFDGRVVERSGPDRTPVSERTVLQT